MSNATLPAESDVLVVGAGPAGMVTAALLERLGMTVRILERFPSRLALPKAHVVGPVTLDICVQAGLDVDRMSADAHPRNGINSFDSRLGCSANSSAPSPTSTSPRNGPRGRESTSPNRDSKRSSKMMCVSALASSGSAGVGPAHRSTRTKWFPPRPSMTGKSSSAAGT